MLIWCRNSRPSHWMSGQKSVSIRRLTLHSDPKHPKHFGFRLLALLQISLLWLPKFWLLLPRATATENWQQSLTQPQPFTHSGPGAPKICGCCHNLQLWGLRWQIALYLPFVGYSLLAHFWPKTRQTPGTRPGHTWHLTANWMMKNFSSRRFGLVGGDDDDDNFLPVIKNLRHLPAKIEGESFLIQNLKGGMKGKLLGN